jgi:hypothetical protein
MRQQRLTTKLPITIVFFWFKNCIPLHFFNSNTRAITHISLPFIHEKCSYRVSSFDEKLFTILHLHQVRPNKSDNDDDNTHKDSCWRAHTHTHFQLVLQVLTLLGVYLYLHLSYYTRLSLWLLQF